MEDSYLSQDRLSELSGVPFYSINYLVRLGKIDVIKNGKGRPRLFPKSAIDQVRKWKEGNSNTQIGLEDATTILSD